MAFTPALTLTDLASFSGRSEDSYRLADYVDEIISQATDLLQLATGLSEWPSDPLNARLAKRGVLDMADALYLSQAHRKAVISPFQSETIGSYSYSKAARQIAGGFPTGIGWFDLARATLIQTDDVLTSVFANTATTVFENDTIGVDISKAPNRRTVVGPADSPWVENGQANWPYGFDPWWP